MSKRKSVRWMRSRARRMALQAVYQWQLTGTPGADLEFEFADREGFADIDQEWFSAAIRAVIYGSDELDAELATVLDRPISALDPVERGILRLGVWELRERLDVPFRVVIDQGVTLAKDFGAKDSHGYINGVLDKMARRLRAAELAQ